LLPGGQRPAQALLTQVTPPAHLLGRLTALPQLREEHLRVGLLAQRQVPVRRRHLRGQLNQLLDQCIQHGHRRPPPLASCSRDRGGRPSRCATVLICRACWRQQPPPLPQYRHPPAPRRLTGHPPTSGGESPAHAPTPAADRTAPPSTG